MTTIAIPVINFYRWHGVESTVGANAAEYTWVNALQACFWQSFPLLMLYPSAPCRRTLSMRFLSHPPSITLPLEVSGKGPIVDQGVSSNSCVKILTPNPSECEGICR